MLAKKLQQAVAGAGGEALYVENVFSTYLYTGNGSTQTITNDIDLSGEGGLVWLKSRSTTYNHNLFDTVRGVENRLSTNNTNAADSGAGGVTAFNADGFTLDSTVGYNDSPYTFASWTFRKAPKFFDVLTVTLGTSTDRSVTHNLGSTPGVIIGKKTNDTSNWVVYHRSLGKDKWLGLQTTNAATTRSNTWGSAEPTDSTFRFDEPYFGNSGDVYVFYLFAHDAGGFGDSGEESVIKCGSYSGTGASGNSITLDWEPQWLLIKRIDSSGNWNIIDTMRGMPVGTGDRWLFTNTTDSEDTGSNDRVDPTATGFTLKTSFGDWNASGATYVYIAIRRGPMKTPEDATKVFMPDLASSSGVFTFDTGFPVDAVIYQYRPGGGSFGGFTFDRLRGGRYLGTATTAAEVTDGNGVFDYNDKFKYLAATGDYSGYIGWLFQRAPGFFDVVCHSATSGIKHNLGVVPEMIISKLRSTGNWRVYHKNCTGDVYLNLTNAQDTSFSHTSITSTQFDWSNSGAAGISYLFASVPGVSKVGSYTGDGNDPKTIDCGFSNGARFVLIKKSSGSGSWYVFDTARGIVSGNDPYLLLNSTDAEDSGFDYIDPVSSGFQVNAALNSGSTTYIYLAIA